MLFSKIITTSGRYVKGDHPHFIEKIAIYFRQSKWLPPIITEIGVIVKRFFRGCRIYTLHNGLRPCIIISTILQLKRQRYAFKYYYCWKSAFSGWQAEKKNFKPVSIKWMQRQQFSGSKSTGNDFARIFLQWTTNRCPPLRSLPQNAAEGLSPKHNERKGHRCFPKTYPCCQDRCCTKADSAAHLEQVPWAGVRIRRQKERELLQGTG